MNNIIKDNELTQHMHPLWMLFSLGKSIREIIVFVIFFMVDIGLKLDSIYINFAKIAAIFYVIYKVFTIFLDWRHFKYYFTQEEICVFKGRFIKEKRFIPLERIQGVSQSRNFFHRLFGLTSLILDTGATGDDASVKLEVITRKEAERIQKYLSQVGVFREQTNVQNKDLSEVTVLNGSTRKKNYEMSKKEIFLSSLTSLKLLMVIPLFNMIYSDTNMFFSVDKYIDSTVSFFQKSWQMTTIGIIVIVIFSIAYGMVKTYIQYGNFEVTSDQKRIFIQTGMFNQAEFSIPKEKVQAINFHTSLLKRWIGLVEVKIICTNDMNDKEMKTANILFPFIDKKRALLLVSEILPTFKVETKMTNIPRSSIFVKLVRSSYIWILSIPIVFYFYPKLWYISLILFILVVISQVLSGLHNSYNLNGSFIQLQKGSFSKSIFITTQMNIEELKVTESGLQRIFGLASLQIATRAKPVQITKIADIPKDMAIIYYQWYENRKNNEKYIEVR
ncbi:hypothetical protein CN285_22005 [Bacillus cereus]|uniref:PH domain-containing protein n=1 Tax=Bacillus paramycoides TaxID=2026194 RepID=UPI000BF671C4|nr:PH domain-containing protein [Bacillus paramycoides]PFD36462.1 hypothetical protein CN285_22005 [Bacillus cereus]